MTDLYQGMQVTPLTPPPVAPALPAGLYDGMTVTPIGQKPREPKGFVESFQAGVQGSAPGLAWRGKLPELVLNPETAKWWERAAAGFGHVIPELPLMIGGAVVGAPAGAAVGTAIGGPAAPAAAPVGAILGAGFGMGVVPATIRQSLIEAYKSGEVKTAADWFSSVKEVAKAALAEGGINAAAMGAGAIARGAVATATAGKEVGRAVGLGTATTASRGAARLTETADIATQIVAMTTIPAAAQGRLPDWQEFMDAAIVIGGLKAAHVSAGYVMNNYLKTGRTPLEQVADAKADPKIAEEMTTPREPAFADVPLGTDGRFEVLKVQETLFTETARLNELEAKAQGTEARTVIGEDGRSMVIPSRPPEFLTDAERAELPALRARVAELEAMVKAPKEEPAPSYSTTQIEEAKGRGVARAAELAEKAAKQALSDAERAERVFLTNAAPEAMARHFGLEPIRITAEMREASAQKVHDDVLQQLREADRARQDFGLQPLGDDHAMAVAALVRARLRTRAARLGVLPETLFEERPLRIVDETAAEVREAEAAIPPDAPRFEVPEVDLFGDPVEVPMVPRLAVENMATVEVPLANLVLSKEVPQFKMAANEQGVIVPLGGRFDRTGVGPIQVWERLDGTLEVISGRHRLDLARRSGEETIPAQIHKESEGFTAKRASALDAELNIREEQGSVADYVQHFENSGLTKEAADELGLLARAKGRTGFAIARDGSADLKAAHRAGLLSDEAALSISAAAPGSERLQALGIAMVNEGKSILIAVNTMRAVDVMASERMASGAQGDIFGFDDSAMREAATMAKKASSIQRKIGEQIAAVSGASKRPELAKKMGVDVQDPEGIQKRIAELRQEQYLWDNWPLHPELVARLRAQELHQAARTEDMKYQREQVSKYAEQMGFEIYEEHGSGLSRSQYLKLRYNIKRDADGEPTDWDALKLRFSDHDLPPSYKRVHGEADFEVSPTSRMDQGGATWIDAIKWLADKIGADLPPAVRATESRAITTLYKQAIRNAEQFVMYHENELQQFNAAVESGEIVASKSRSSKNWNLRGPMNAAGFMGLGRRDGEVFSQELAIRYAREKLESDLLDAKQKLQNLREADTLKQGPVVDRIADYVDALNGGADALTGQISLFHPKVRISITENPNGGLFLDGIQVIDPSGRRRGAGTAAMEDVTKVADRAGRQVVLMAYPENPEVMSLAALESWYRRFGFEALPKEDQEFPGQATYMVRAPRREQRGEETRTEATAQEADTEGSARESDARGSGGEAVSGPDAREGAALEFELKPETPAELAARNAEAIAQAKRKIEQERLGAQQQITKAVQADLFNTQGMPLFQQHRGSYEVAENLITIMRGSDKSTVIHELSHSWLEEMKIDAARPDAPAQIKADWDIIRREFAIPESGEISRASHEQFARTGERYFGEGEAPSVGLRAVFERFKVWLLEIYNDLRNLNVDINPEIRAVFDRMLATDAEIAEARDLGVPRAYVPEAKAQEARKIVPGFKAEQISMEPYADELPKGPGEAPDNSHVNYAYINTPTDVKLTMQRMAEIDQAAIQQHRGGTDGVKSWAEANAEQARYLNDILGGSEDTLRLLSPRDPNAPGPDVRLGILKKLAVGAAEDSARLRDIILQKGDDATVREQLEYLGSIERARMIQAEFLGERAGVARALNALKDTTEGSGEIGRMLDAIGYGEDAGKLFQAAKTPAEEAAILKAKLDEILLNYKGKTVLDIAKLHKEIGSLKGTFKFAKEVSAATKWEMVVEGWKAAMLSGPVTHTTNLFGTGTFQVLRAPVDALAAIIGMARGASPGMGESDRASMSEAVARITGMLGGLQDGLKAGYHTFRQDDPSGKTEQYRTAIPGRAGEIIRIPLRLMGAEDAIVSTMYRRGEIKTLAIRKAFDEGMSPSSREFAERVDSLTDHPTPEMDVAADAAATRMTFNMPLGEKGVALQLFVNKWNLQWMMPFIRTPINIAKEFARLSPFAPLVGEWRAAMAKGGVERDRAIAEIALGTGLMTVAMAYAFDGDLSGAGSPDPGKNRGKAGVWQPYSVLIGDTWYEYQRIQPFGTLIGMAADVAAVWDHMTEEEMDKVPKMLALAFSNAVTNQTFLQGITNFVNALSDPTRFGPRFFQQFAGSMVPNVIGQPTAMSDPVVREVNGMLEAIQARIPGMRQDLLPKRDWLGEPVPTKERLGVVSPIRETKVSEDKVRLEAARLDISMAAAPKKTHIGKGTGKLGDVELTPEERDKFAETGGKMAHQILTNVVNAPGWDAMPDLIKRKIYRNVLTASHKYAAAMALPMDKRAAYVQSITERVASELQPVTQEQP